MSQVEKNLRMQRVGQGPPCQDAAFFPHGMQPGMGLPCGQWSLGVPRSCHWWPVGWTPGPAQVACGGKLGPWEPD